MADDGDDPSLVTLPFDLVERIVARLPLRDVLALRAVSTALRDHVGECDGYWHALMVERAVPCAGKWVHDDGNGREAHRGPLLVGCVEGAGPQRPNTRASRLTRVEWARQSAMPRAARSAVLEAMRERDDGDERVSLHAFRRTPLPPEARFVCTHRTHRIARFVPTPRHTRAPPWDLFVLWCCRRISRRATHALSKRAKRLRGKLEPVERRLHKIREAQDGLEGLMARAVEKGRNRRVGGT
jgi:hypothetical protein